MNFVLYHLMIRQYRHFVFVVFSILVVDVETDLKVFLTHLHLGILHLSIETAMLFASNKYRLTKTHNRSRTINPEPERGIVLGVRSFLMENARALGPD